VVHGRVPAAFRGWRCGPRQPQHLIPPVPLAQAAAGHAATPEGCRAASPRVRQCTRKLTSQPSSTTTISTTPPAGRSKWYRSEEHTSELQSRENLVCRLLLEKKKKNKRTNDPRMKHHRRVT